MLIKVKRIPSIGGPTIGDLFIDGKWYCYTLEDEVRPEGVKIDGKTAIPAGKYPLIIDYSFRFKRYMPHILNVQNFTGVRIHKGNTEENTEGCILVAMERGNTTIWDCKPAFDNVFNAICSSDNTSMIEIC